MAKVIPIENDTEREAAEAFWFDLQRAADNNAPGWMMEASGLQAVLDRLERAINAFDRKYPDGRPD